MYICATLRVYDNTEDTMVALKHAMEQSFDMIEFRFESTTLELSSIKELLSHVPVPYIVSVRSEWADGGLKPPNQSRR